MHNNIISIITPSFNQDEYLRYTIESVLSQKGNFFLDYIIVDGLSSDKSKDIIIKYEELLKNNCKRKIIDGNEWYINTNKDFYLNQCLGVNYRWLSEKDTGHGNALNKGFNISIGNIMAWINSDDIYYPNTLNTVYTVFNKYHYINWIMGKPSMIDNNGNIVKEIYEFLDINDYLLGNYKWIQQESTFWKRDLWKKTGSYINENYKLMVDGELWTRFFLYDQLYFIDSKLGAYRYTTNNRAIVQMKFVINEMDIAIEKLSIEYFKSQDKYFFLKFSRKLKNNLFIKYFLIILYKFFSKNKYNMITNIDASISIIRTKINFFDELKKLYIFYKHDKFYLYHDKFK